MTGDELIARFQEDQPETVAWDTESPHYKWHLPNMDPFALTFSWRKKRTYYVKCRDDDGQMIEGAAKALYVILSQTPNVVAHNLKYDLHVAKRLLSHFNLPLVVRPVDDTMIMSHVLNENRFHGLKELTTDLGIRFGREDADYWRDEVKKWIGQSKEVTGREAGYDEVPMRLMVPYARQDAFLTLELFNHFGMEMEEQMEQGRGAPDVQDIYNLEMGLLWVLFTAEEHGMRVDIDFCEHRIAELLPEIQDIKATLERELGWEINPGSTDDVAKALGQLGCGDVVWINPRTQKPNLPEWKLEELANDPAAGPTVKAVLDYRTATKMCNSYFETLIEEKLDDKVGQAIVRPNIKQTGARTGRMSVTEPALQTLPRKKGNVRGAFIARHDSTLIFADYSQQELRVLAHYLEKIGDSTMSDIFRRGDVDLHAATAAGVFGVPVTDVTKDQRQAAKTLNFAIVYGAGQKKIATMLDMELEEAKHLLNNYYRTYPGLRTLKRQTEMVMKQRGYLVTAFGRRHRETDMSKAYKAVNSIVQGTSADITKQAMVALNAKYKVRKLKSLILLAVHDEIISETLRREVEESVIAVREAMIDMPQIIVPMEVDINVADRWSEAK